jgi:hypothetical protein
MKLKTVLMTADGTVKEVKPSGRHWTLKEHQKLVGGPVEPLWLMTPDGTPAVMLVHEEGEIRSLPVNETASRLAGQKIVGTVLVGPRTLLH